MSEPAIVVENLSKQYRIGAMQGELMLREAISRGLRNLFSGGEKIPENEQIWALRDVSLEVGSDEVVGVIGRNGSGKTTLLKLLSRITYPTEGRVKVNGRVASLVEVGTGFHNELSGRENVFLNGSILGLKRKEIAKHFDAIVEYSGVGKFIDTPIKRYSTGMRLRLGFAVAAHLFPDVLLVDEVLAVGDAEFQAKCLKTLTDVGQRGHTVLFVSHNLEAIESICPRTIWIDRGTLRMDGPSRDVIAAYLKETTSLHQTVVELADIEQRSGSGEGRYTRIEFLDLERRPKDLIRSGDGLVIRLHFHVPKELQGPYFGMLLATEFGTLVCHPNSWSTGLEIGSLGPGDHALDLEIPALRLMPGSYPLSLWMNRHSDKSPIDYLDQCAVLNVHAPQQEVLGRLLDRRRGVTYLDAQWQLAD